MEGNGNDSQNQMFQNFLNTLFIRLNHNMNQNMNQNSLIDTVMERSFNEENSTIKKAKQSFIDDLEIIECKDKDIVCSICMDQIKEREKIVKLPCNGTPHYFHTEHETCGGIFEWLNINNTCPICRSEFPYDEISKHDTNSETSSTETQINTNGIVVQPTVNVTNDNSDEEVYEINFGIVHDESQQTNIVNMFHQTINNIVDEREEEMLQQAIINSLSTSES